MADESDNWLEIDTEADWLRIEDPNAGKVSQPFQNLVNACMRGTDRVMACDGHYLAYRPFNRAFDKETNPRTKERFNDFVAAAMASGEKAHAFDDLVDTLHLFFKERRREVRL